MEYELAFRPAFDAEMVMVVGNGERGCAISVSESVFSVFIMNFLPSD